jgi:MarR family transcriptional regulator, organic hydroperoxide resistance regulator
LTATAELDTKLTEGSVDHFVLHDSNGIRTSTPKTNFFLRLLNDRSKLLRISAYTVGTAVAKGTPMKSERTDTADSRARLERRMGADLRELTSESDWISRSFAEQNHVSANEFRALLFVMLAEGSGVQLTAGDLRKQMGLSGAAITYLVERMAENGHLRRETDPSDRRKVILRYGQHGMSVATEFFSKLSKHNEQAMAHLPAEDLEAAHRVFTSMVDAMRSFREDLAAPGHPEINHG